MDPASAIICSWCPDDDVVAAVVIQVGQDDRCSELTARHPLAETGSLLRQDVARSCGKPQIDLAGIAITPRHTNDQIRLAIAVHITAGRDSGLTVGLSGGRALSRC